MIKKYLINFWIWWYGAKICSVFKSAYSFWSLSLANLNILPMMANLFVPMYQDRSLTGKFISFILRSTWVFFGTIIQILITIPIIAVLVLWIFIPFIVLVQLIRFFL